MSGLNLKNKRILVVEDDELSFLYLKQLLMIANASFDREITGSGVLNRFKESSGAFDLILMDIQLPDIDGMTVTREIRKSGSKVPIIAHTASRSPVEKELAISAGCTDIITKPFTMEELFALIAQYLVADKE